ncbi:MAG: YceI family protein [Saprospiraceae bacterium]|nr:YceI family protein [Saprospiraceae bacterium]
MKNAKLFLAFVAGMVIYTVAFYTSSCTREDAIVAAIEPPDYQYGTDTVSSASGWNFDKTHSNVMWESPYKGVASLLTGRFNTFSTTVNFREDHPELSTFSGFVVLSTVNTGEPGRDGGCLLTTFGTTTISDTARLVSKTVEFDGKGGYIATADLNFHGVTKEVKVQLNYSGKTYIEATAPYYVAGLTGQFEFNAISDFALVSTNIADRVVVKLNMLFRHPV